MDADLRAGAARAAGAGVAGRQRPAVEARQAQDHEGRVAQAVDPELLGNRVAGRGRGPADALPRERPVAILVGPIEEIEPPVEQLDRKAVREVVCYQRC